jgi:hypothetical protein
MFLLLPMGIVFEIILKAVGRHMAAPIPCSPRNAVSWAPVCERPAARTNNPAKKQPKMFILRFPMWSAIEPARKRKQPLVRLKGFIRYCNLLFCALTYEYIDWGLE